MDRRTILADSDQYAIVENIHQVADKASTPLQRWESSLEMPVALLVLPAFALANAGISLDSALLTQLAAPVSMGIIAGPVVGKPLGICLMSWMVLRFRLGRLPGQLSMRHIIGVGFLAGMGFTMSMFIANLGFGPDMEQLLAAKSAIMLSSLLAGLAGFTSLWLAGNSGARRESGIRK